MRSRIGRSAKLLAAVSLAALTSAAAAGCGLLPAKGPVEEVAIEPAAPAAASADFDLGPGVRPLSLGPGDKDSPRISPSGDRIAFVLDGYAVEKSLYAQEEDLRRRIAKGSAATNVDWLSEASLSILGPARSNAPNGQASSLFVVRPGQPQGVDELADGVRTVGAPAGGGSVVAAVETPAGGAPWTTLVRFRASGESTRRFLGDLGGSVSGLSLSPDGREAVMAVRREPGRAELVTYRFAEGEPRHVAVLGEGMEVIGAPQQTSRGIYFVAGEEGDEEAGYTLYRVPEGSEQYEPVRAVGEDFVPASVAVSPDGGRLAVLGRRSSRSPTDLYVLDLASDALDAVTANENMEIKTKPDDLAWSPDGSYVVVVARGMLTGPKVYNSPAQDLSAAFYNVYGVPVGSASRAPRGQAG